MKIRRRYHADGPTAVFIAITLLIGAGAVNSQNNLLFLVFGLAVAMIVVSGLLSGTIMMGLRAERELPAIGAVGEPVAIRYRVINDSRRLPAFALGIGECGAARSARRAPRWQRILGRPEACVLHVGPRQFATAAAVVTPVARGEALLEGVRVSSAFPFGLFRKSIECAHPQSILVHPRLLHLRRDALRELMAGAHIGWRSHNSRGPGEDFFGLRDYRPGDPVRSIAWKRTARTGDIVVRDHAAPHAGALMVVLNLNGADDDANESAISLAGSIAVEALRAGMDVGLDVPSHGLRVEPDSSARQRTLVLSALARIDLHEAPRRSAPAPSAEPGRLAHLAVHAGAPDPTAAPPGALHVGSGDAPALLASDPDPAISREGAVP